MIFLEFKQPRNAKSNKHLQTHLHTQWETEVLTMSKICKADLRMNVGI